MSDELRAAYEHHRAVLARQHSPYIRENGRHGGSPWAELMDAIESHLALVPADDGEAASLDWFRQIGGIIRRAPAGGHYADFMVNDTDEFRMWLRLHDPAGSSDGHVIPDLFVNDGGGDLGIGLTGHWPKTRGDVRRLALALGISLKEST